MADGSAIEWTEATWNPVTACTKVSPGCDHCYAETFAERWRGIPGHPHEQGFDLKLHPDRLTQPLRWKRPRLIFTNSMSDLFHRDVPDGFVMHVWRVMGLAGHHTFQILTKRADRLERWVRRWADHYEEQGPVLARGPAEVRAAHGTGRARLFADMIERWGEPPNGPANPLYDWMEGMRWWPEALPNVWLGVSVESPAYYSRIRHLQRTPAVVDFLSCEPLLQPLPALALDGIRWVVAGGESGPHARPCELDWLRDLRDQCKAAGVPFFLKQLDGHPDKRGHEKALLDGRLWREMRGADDPASSTDRSKQ